MPRMLALAAEPDEAALRAHIEQGLRAARRIGADGLLRLRFDLGAVEPWRLLRARGLADRPERFAWHDEAGDLSYVALGSVASVEAAGPARFDAVQRWCSTIFERTSLPPREPAHVPVLVGGFAFSDAAAAEGPWAGWPAARWWMPEVLVARRAGRSVLVLCAPQSGSASALAARATAVREALAAPPSPPRTASIASPGEDEPRERWCRGVSIVRRRIEKGELDKVVLARARRFKAPKGTLFDAEATAEHLRERERRAITYLVQGPRGSAFVGATPEVLARVDGARLSTVALAGTRQRDADPARDRALEVELMHSAKDRTEQSIVTAVILAALAPLSSSIEHPDEPQIERQRHVVHLRTPISAVLRPGKGPLEVAARLHPTPAVAGAPVGEALAAIAEHEALHRGWYAGPIGWLGGERAVFAVALRSALLQEEEAWAFAGAGIVAASDPEAEWRETAHKMATIERSLAAREKG